MNDIKVKERMHRTFPGMPSRLSSNSSLGSLYQRKHAHSHWHAYKYIYIYMYIYPAKKTLFFPCFLGITSKLLPQLATFTLWSNGKPKMQSSFIEIQFQLCMASWNQWTFQHNLIGCTWAHRYLWDGEVSWKFLEWLLIGLRMGVGDQCKLG